MIKQQIVHGPEPTLGIGCLCGFRGLLRKRMFMNQGEVAKDEPRAISESSLKSFDDGIGTPAIGAFEITVGHERDRRIFWSGDMVIVPDGKRLYRQNAFSCAFTPRAPRPVFYTDPHSNMSSVTTAFVSTRW